MYHFDKSKIKKRNILKRVSAVALSCVIVVALFSIFSLASPEGINDHIIAYPVSEFSDSEVPRPLVSSHNIAVGAIDDFTVRSGSQYGYAFMCISYADRQTFSSGCANMNVWDDIINYAITSGNCYYAFLAYDFQTNYVDDNKDLWQTNDSPTFNGFPIPALGPDSWTFLKGTYYLYDANGEYLGTAVGKKAYFANPNSYYSMGIMADEGDAKLFYLNFGDVKIIPVQWVWANGITVYDCYLRVRCLTYIATVNTYYYYVFSPDSSGKSQVRYYANQSYTSYPDCDTAWEASINKFVDIFKLNYIPPPPPTDFASEIIRVSPILGTIIVNIFEVPLLGWLLMVLGCFSLIGFVIYIVKNSLGGNGGDV